MSSPKPPSSCWTESSHSTARRIAGWSDGTPQASSAGSAAPVPYRWLTPQRPNHEPSSSCSASSHLSPRSTDAEYPSGASASSACAVTSELGSSVTLPKSQNGILYSHIALESTSKAPQPPPFDC